MIPLLTVLAVLITGAVDIALYFPAVFVGNRSPGFVSDAYLRDLDLDPFYGRCLLVVLGTGVCCLQGRAQQKQPRY